MDKNEIKLRQIIREELKQQLKEVDYAEVRIPGNLTKFLEKFTDTVKKINLNKNQQIAIIYNILKGLDISIEEFTYMYKKIKDMEV